MGKERRIKYGVPRIENPRIENGNPCLQLKVEKRGVGPTIRITDENGNPRIGIGVDKDGPRLRLYDENGKTLWKAP